MLTSWHYALEAHKVAKDSDQVICYKSQEESHLRRPADRSNRQAVGWGHEMKGAVGSLVVCGESASSTGDCGWVWTTSGEKQSFKLISPSTFPDGPARDVAAKGSIPMTNVALEYPHSVLRDCVNCALSFA
jgi:hypothetical protein